MGVRSDEAVLITGAYGAGHEPRRRVKGATDRWLPDHVVAGHVEERGALLAVVVPRADLDRVPSRARPAPGEQHRARQRYPRTGLVLPDPRLVERQAAVDEEPRVTGLAALLAERADDGHGAAGEREAYRAGAQGRRIGHERGTGPEPRAS